MLTHIVTCSRHCTAEAGSPSARCAFPHCLDPPPPTITDLTEAACSACARARRRLCLDDASAKLMLAPCYLSEPRQP
eukprot:3940451-Amphidinium_carterae.1